MRRVCRYSFAFPNMLSVHRPEFKQIGVIKKDCFVIYFLGKKPKTKQVNFGFIVKFCETDGCQGYELFTHIAPIKEIFQL